MNGKYVGAIPERNRMSATVHGAILTAFRIPPCLLGGSLEPRSEQERNDGLLLMAETAGFDPYALGSREIEEAALRRYLWLAGISS